jgi:hypothetical protein
MRSVCTFIVLLLFATLTSSVQAEDLAPDFAKVGRTFIEKHCLECHNNSEPQAELTLEPYQNAMDVAKGRKAFEKVMKMVVAGEMPPQEKPRPDAAEVERFAEHINAIFEHAARHAKPDPGRVTMRRLNRLEYRNTIADLIGVDFDPTEDFPADDVGHGFDHIGDVLSVSPVLMERYLAAAESIVNRAILPDPPNVPKRHLASRYTEPASQKVERELMVGEYRRLASDASEEIERGPLHTPYQWDEEGEYVFRTRVYGNGDDQNPVTVAVLVSGENLADASNNDAFNNLVGNVMKPARLLQTFAVKANKPDQAELLEVKIPAMAGRSRMMVALVKPTEGKPPAQLFVEHLALDGPLDTRPASQRRLLARDESKPQGEQTREVLSRFLRRAYRRLPTSDETERLAKLVDAQVAEGAKWEAGVQFAIQAALCSPKFLFRAELDDQPLDGPAQAIDEFSLASRLSYFLWSTMPDDELLDLAEKKQLTTQLDVQVKRMLAHPKSATLVENFALQWLQLKRLDSVAPDASMFSSFNDSLRASMRQETTLFFDSVMREDRSILELLDADYTFLNERLANHYGIADTAGNWIDQPKTREGGEPFRGREFRRVSLQGGSRGGLLTQASVLTVTSNPTRTSPVKRGRWVLEQILGAPPPPPPPNVPELEESGEHVEGASLRERMELHRQNPSCAGCHAKMDPIGFAFENYNAIGAYRDKDGEFPIDPAGELTDGTKFSGPEALKQILRQRSSEFARCLVEKMMIYSLGRGLEYYDSPSIDKIVKSLSEQDYKFSVLVTGIVNSDPFRMRRGSDLELMESSP